MSAGYACFAVGMVAAGPLTDAIGAREVWVVSAALLAAAAVTAYFMLSRVASERTGGEPAADEAYCPTSSVL